MRPSGAGRSPKRHDRPGPSRCTRAPGTGEAPADAVAPLDISLRRRTSGALPGDHLTSGAADGMELARLRPYEAGDDVRRLGPAASGRTGGPHIRLQVPERAVTTWLVVDVSP